MPGRPLPSGFFAPPPPPPPPGAIHPPPPPPYYLYNSNVRAPQQQQPERQKRNQCYTSQQPSPPKKRRTEDPQKNHKKQQKQPSHYNYNNNNSSGGFQTVTIAVPGCPVQRFRICVGNRPQDVQAWIRDRRNKFPRAQKKNLAQLLQGYSSPSSEEEEEDQTDQPKNQPGNHPTKKGTEQPLPLHQPPPRRVCKFFRRNGHCRNGDACRFLHEGHENASHKQQRVAARKNKKTHSLLDKLLQNDAQRELALGLQVIEFLVDHRFLQDNHKTTNKTDATTL